MVVELILNPAKAEKKPWEMMFVGVFYASMAAILSLWIFKDNASLWNVFFTVMACMPFIYFTIKYEEGKDLEHNNDIFLLKEHIKALRVFMYLFIGITLTYAMWYVFLPSNMANVLFEIPTKSITDINNSVTGFTYGFDVLLKII